MPPQKTKHNKTKARDQSTLASTIVGVTHHARSCMVSHSHVQDPRETEMKNSQSSNRFKDKHDLALLGTPVLPCLTSPRLINLCLHCSFTIGSSPLEKVWMIHGV
ncbi:hypothetical protein HanIR_Chr10g0451401 [Helianthus annuus]|nr:hypothetical protein HanIR_Chr10g0451401 [Helianthus annuus]